MLRGGSAHTFLSLPLPPPWLCRLGKVWASSALCWLSCLGRVVVISVGTSPSFFHSGWPLVGVVCDIEPTWPPSLRQPMCKFPSVRFVIGSSAFREVGWLGRVVVVLIGTCRVVEVLI